MRIVGRLGTVTAIGVALVLTACAEQQEPEPSPTLGLPAMQLHMCVRPDAGYDEDCADAAVDSCPIDHARDECLSNALAEIEAYDQHQANPPAEGGGGLPPIGLVATAMITLAAFAVIGWRVARRTSKRNAASFDAVLPTLNAQGFRRDDAPLLPAFQSMRGHRLVRGVNREAPAPLWLVEFEHWGRLINEMWPRRAAAFPTPVALPDGVLRPVLHPTDDAWFSSSFPGSTRDDREILELVETISVLLAEHHPALGLEAKDGVVLLVELSIGNSVGKKGPPAFDLVQLATLAERFRTVLAAEPPAVEPPAP